VITCTSSVTFIVGGVSPAIFPLPNNLQRDVQATYLSSATGLTPTAWGDAIRGHWGIENRNHYVRDVSCEEDKCRIRNNPGIMARARSWVGRPGHVNLHGKKRRFGHYSCDLAAKSRFLLRRRHGRPV
jgi:hypothetical protein